MVSEIIMHHNDLNTVIMRTWKAEEMNFFFAILAKAKNKGTKELVFETEEIKSLIKYSNKNKKRWENTMVNCAKKVVQLTYFEKTEGTFEVMTIFSKFTINLDKQKVFIKLSENFDYILNQLNANFTTYELEEFTKIRSTYVKTIYRLLKQWRTVGRKEFQINEFKLLLDMPDYYTPSEIDRLIIKPTSKELAFYFSNLKIKKIKSNKRGNPILGYRFTWKPEKTGKVWNNSVHNKFYRSLKLTNVTERANSDYINNTTPRQKERLEKIKKKALSRIKNLK